MSWMIWVFFVGPLWICPVSCERKCNSQEKKETVRGPTDCFTPGTTHLAVADKFSGFISAQKHWNEKCQTQNQNQGTRNGRTDGRRANTRNGCIVFLQKNATRSKHQDKWLQMVKNDDGSYLLRISKWHINKKFCLHVVEGKKCNATLSGLNDSTCVFNQSLTGSCLVRCVDTQTICQQSKYENNCGTNGPWTKNRYFINITATNNNCLNCDDPVKKPEEDIELDVPIPNEGKELNAAQAAGVMRHMTNLATSMKGSSALLTVGEGVSGILVRETEPADVDEVSFAYVSPNDSLNIIDNRDTLAQFSRSVTVSKEAFEKAVSMNVSVPFAALLRFNNLASDEMNSTVLGNEVLAIEMGTTITNLTDKICISFRKTKYEGVPSCHSWNGEGSRPKWTDDGCLTKKNGDNITCECSHLTFFAILLAPLNDTLSSSDLNNLTIITKVGCGVSMFFLSIVLFMHFLLRRTSAGTATKILIQLVSAMFLLNLTFLINNFVADLKSSVGCKVMAALMHYSMLATFTWFAVQAFHLCLQLYAGGKIQIRHYMLKVSIISWVLPSVVVIVLLSTGKYGEQLIHTTNSSETVAMCWITDKDAHYIVNIGYYALVFLFTFTTFIIILSWLFCLKRARTRAGTAENSTNGKSIVIVLGLCCMLGITWGFAFFSHGILRIPSYYIFTVLNSFQGFFLFIYYYKTSPSREITGGMSDDKSSSNTSTLKTSLNSFENPYANPPDKEIKPSDTKGD